MATRRKSAGFSSVPDEELLEDISTDLLEEEPPFSAPEVLPEIAPTDDTGPRFVEEVVAPVVQEKPAEPAPRLQPPPKRHPRNVPKFSRYK